MTSLFYNIILYKILDKIKGKIEQEIQFILNYYFVIYIQLKSFYIYL